LALLVEQVGWRSTCLAYAGLHLFVTLPLVLGLIPEAPALANGGDVKHLGEAPLTSRERRAFAQMAGVLVLGGIVTTLISVHLITLLQARGVAFAAAVSYGALIGPSQVGARVVEMANKGRHHPLWTLTVAMALVALGLAILAVGVPAVGIALVLYGAGNGIYSIARGTVPLALCGAARAAESDRPGSRSVAGGHGSHLRRPRFGLCPSGGARARERRFDRRIVGHTTGSGRHPERGRGGLEEQVLRVSSQAEEPPSQRPPSSL
jgi:hypothetical protein